MFINNFDNLKIEFTKNKESDRHLDIKVETDYEIIEITKFLERNHINMEIYTPTNEQVGIPEIITGEWNIPTFKPFPEFKFNIEGTIMSEVTVQNKKKPIDLRIGDRVVSKQNNNEYLIIRGEKGQVLSLFLHNHTVHDNITVLENNIRSGFAEIKRGDRDCTVKK